MSRLDDLIQSAPQAGLQRALHIFLDFWAPQPRFCRRPGSIIAERLRRHFDVRPDEWFD